MILTGKAKEDFEKWNNDIYGFVDTAHNIECIGFKNLNPELQHSVIIDWFDSVGIFIRIDPDIYSYTGLSFYVSVNDELIDKLDSRHEATKQAIIKANEIYNKRGN